MIFESTPLKTLCQPLKASFKPIIVICLLYMRASLACAARLADTLCPPEAAFGRLDVRLVNYKGDIISKYVHLSFKIDITRKITKFVNFKFLMRNDDIITK